MRFGLYRCLAWMRVRAPVSRASGATINRVQEVKHEKSDLGTNTIIVRFMPVVNRMDI